MSRRLQSRIVLFALLAQLLVLSCGAQSPATTTVAPLPIPSAAAASPSETPASPAPAMSADGFYEIGNPVLLDLYIAPVSYTHLTLPTIYSV